MSDSGFSLRDVFAEAKEISDPAARSAYLDRVCGTGSVSRREIEELLQAASPAGGFLPDQSSDASRSVLQEILGVAAVAGVGGGPLPGRAGERIGRYELLERLGEGGCGVVYRAQQEAPVRRQVALKIIKPGMDTNAVIARFMAERQALALMDHPNIAKVFDAGSTDSPESEPSDDPRGVRHGRPFFVMELVPGRKITDFCRDHQLPVRARLELFLGVCQAVQHAHQKGVIHRDLKPSNVLVTTVEGVAVPKVIDFGIAKATEGRLTDQTLFTAVEHFIGTPAYMSPEQSAMSADVDTRSDIYSLGVLLYELLTGATPFDTRKLLELGVETLLRTIREEDPIRPSVRLARESAAADPASPPGLSPLRAPSADGRPSVAAPTEAVSPRRRPPTRIDSDLDWIVMKCLEKDRNRRYATANGLAADLRRHLDHEPVLARPSSRLYELRKTVRRHRAGFVTAAAVLVVLVAGVCASTWQAVRASRAEREQIRLRRLANAQAYASDLNLANVSWEKGDQNRARRLLEAHIPSLGEPDLRGFEWRYLWNLCREESLRTLPLDDPIGPLVTTPALRHVVVGCEKSVRLLDPATGREILRLAYPNPEAPDPFPVIALASRTTNLLAAHRAGGWVTLWDFAKRAPPTEFRAFTNNVGVLALSPDGRYLAAASRGLFYSTALCVWDIASGPPSPGLVWSNATAVAFGALAFSPDGKCLVAAGASAADARILVFATETGRALEPIPDASAGMINAIAFSPDGSLLAASGNDNRIHVWSFPVGTLRTHFDGHPGAISALSFSEDGRWLVSAGSDGTIRRWDVESNAPAGIWRDRPGGPRGVVFAPGNRALVSATRDSVKIWNPEPRPPAAVLEAERGWGFTLVSPNGKWLLTLGGIGNSPERGVAVWDLESGVRKFVLPFRGTLPYGAAFSPAGQLFALGDLQREGLVGLWDCRSWEDSHPDLRPIAHLTNGFEAGSLAFSPDGKTLAVAGLSFPPFSPPEPSGATNRLAFWDVGSRARVTLLPDAGIGSTERAGAGTVAYSPDGQCLAVGHRDGRVRLWDIRERRIRMEWRVDAADSWWGVDVRFSPDGRWLVAYFIGGASLTLLDLANLARPPVPLIRDDPAGVFKAGFAPDGKTLVTGHGGGELQCWSLESFAVALTLPNGHGPGCFPAFSPDGNLLISKTAQGTVRLFRAVPVSELLPARDRKAVGSPE